MELTFLGRESTFPRTTGTPLKLTSFIADAVQDYSIAINEKT
jgi:hypothetical protein